MFLPSAAGCGFKPRSLGRRYPTFQSASVCTLRQSITLGHTCRVWDLEFQLQLLSNVEYQIKFTKYSQVHGISKSEATSQKSKCHTFAYQKSKMGVWAKVHRGQSEWLNGAVCGVKAALPSRAVGKQGTSHTAV